jgi:putative membrane protein insertion efficiency factor
MPSAFRKALATVLRLPAIVSVLCIRIYQATLSPDHGLLKHLYPHGYCRHHPTCSEYAVQTLKTRSMFVAPFLILRRLLSCHPWAPLTDEKLKAMTDPSSNAGKL